MQYSAVREPSNRPININDQDKNLFLKRTTVRDNQNPNDFRYNMTETRSPIKVTSQMVMNPNFLEEKDKNPPNNNSITNNNYNNNYYKEEPYSQSFNVEAERQNRLSQERQRDYENPENTEPNTDYYYKKTRTASDINDYNNRYTYNYRRDFDYIDFNKLSQSQQFDNTKNMMMDINNNLKYSTPRINTFSRFEKPFEGPTPASRQRSFEPKFRKKEVIWSHFINIKMSNIMDKEILKLSVMIKLMIGIDFIVRLEMIMMEVDMEVILIIII
jgi:hypothetical protein